MVWYAARKEENADSDLVRPIQVEEVAEVDRSR